MKQLRNCHRLEKSNDTRYRGLNIGREKGHCGETGKIQIQCVVKQIILHLVN